MAWESIESCPSCGKQHSLYWPARIIPRDCNLVPLTYICPDTQRQVFFNKSCAWVSVDSCKKDSIELKVSEDLAKR